MSSTEPQTDVSQASEAAIETRDAPATPGSSASTENERATASPEPVVGGAESDPAPAPDAEAGGEDSHDDESPDDDSASDESGTSEEASADGSVATPDGTPAAPGTKKKRRRRKKKPAGANSGAPPASSEQAGQRPSKKQARHRASDRAPFHVGEEVFGKVTAVLETAIMIDLSGKALAIFDRSEMEPDDLVPSTSDRFVARVHNDGARGGLVVLTRKPLREDQSKPLLEQAAKDGSIVHGLVTGVIKGGVDVDLGGVRAFAPASGMDLHPANANFSGLVGQRLDFKVSQYEKAGRDVVVTRRPMLEAEAHERRKHALGLLTEGQVMNGVVRTVVDWGVFVALPEAENVEGLVHATEASHEARAHLGDLFRPGDRIEVKILGIDERGKIWLSRKALVEDPWGAARKKYAQGSRHTGKVVRLEKFGAFVELEPGMDGLLHVSDLSFERVDHSSDLLKEGQELEVVVNYFDFRSKKIGLHPAPPADQANEPAQKITRGALVKAAVVKGESAGVIVRVLGITGRAARGFIPAGQTGTARGTDLRKAFKPGSVLDLKVLDLDPRSGEPKLSIRGFKDDEERHAVREYRQQLKAEGGFGTLGDLLRKKLAKANEPEDDAPTAPAEKADESGG